MTRAAKKSRSRSIKKPKRFDRMHYLLCIDRPLFQTVMEMALASGKRFDDAVDELLRAGLAMRDKP